MSVKLSLLESDLGARSALSPLSPRSERSERSFLRPPRLESLGLLDSLVSRLSSFLPPEASAGVAAFCASEDLLENKDLIQPIKPPELLEAAGAGTGAFDALAFGAALISC